MDNLKVELNTQGIFDLMRSDEMMAVCQEHANKAQARLGTGYKISPYTGKHRVNVSISPESEKAWEDTLENNALLKALRG